MVSFITLLDYRKMLAEAGCNDNNQRPQAKGKAVPYLPLPFFHSFP